MVGETLRSKQISFKQGLRGPTELYDTNTLLFPERLSVCHTLYKQFSVQQSITGNIEIWDNTDKVYLL